MTQFEDIDDFISKIELTQKFDKAFERFKQKINEEVMEHE